MVVPDCLQRRPKGLFKRKTDVVADCCMGLDYLPFVLGQGAFFVQDGVWDADLADIVQDAGNFQGLDFLLGEAQFDAESKRDAGDSFGVTFSIFVLGLNRICERKQDILGAGEVLV